MEEQFRPSEKEPTLADVLKDSMSRWVPNWGGGYVDMSDVVQRQAESAFRDRHAKWAYKTSEERRAWEERRRAR